MYIRTQLMQLDVYTYARATSARSEIFAFVVSRALELLMRHIVPTVVTQNAITVLSEPEPQPLSQTCGFHSVHGTQVLGGASGHPTDSAQESPLHISGGPPADVSSARWAPPTACRMGQMPPSIVHFAVVSRDD